MLYLGPTSYIMDHCTLFYYQPMIRTRKIGVKVGLWLHAYTSMYFLGPHEPPLFSSPELLGSQGEITVYPSSRRPSVGVRRPSVGVRPPFLKIFSETAWPIKAKFYVGLPWEGGTNVCINGPGHMTKMASMPIYGQNHSKIFSRTGGPIFTKLGM